jgi:hypothetical protein
MQGLWEALSCKDKMTKNKSRGGKHRETRRDVAGAKAQAWSAAVELIAQLRIHFEKVKADEAFFSLKQSECRRGDSISYIGMLNAQEALDIERSLLVGHAMMVSEIARKKHIALDRESEKLLIAILNYGAGHVGRT